MKHILVILNFICFSSLSQNLEGVYSGSLVGDQDLILIEKDQGNYLVTLQTGKNTSLLMLGLQKVDGLTFAVPLQDGDELEVFATKEGDVLFLEFELENERFNLSFDSVSKSHRSKVTSSLGNQKDERLIGTWIEKQAFSLDGTIDKEMDNSTKNYKITYSSDGRIIPDSRIFRDVANKHGHQFDFSDIPTFFWSTDNNCVLITQIPSVNQTFQSTYKIQGDSLIVEEEKVRKVFVKEKK